jgi:hypothetical protein
LRTTNRWPHIELMPRILSPKFQASPIESSNNVIRTAGHVTMKSINVVIVNLYSLGKLRTTIKPVRKYAKAQIASINITATPLDNSDHQDPP